MIKYNTRVPDVSMHIANKVAQKGLAGTVCRMQVWIGVQDATDNEENVHW